MNEHYRIDQQMIKDQKNFKYKINELLFKEILPPAQPYLKKPKRKQIIKIQNNIYYNYFLFDQDMKLPAVLSNQSENRINMFLQRSMDASLQNEVSKSAINKTQLNVQRSNKYLDISSEIKEGLPLKLPQLLPLIDSKKRIPTPTSHPYFPGEPVRNSLRYPPSPKVMSTRDNRTSIRQKEFKPFSNELLIPQIRHPSFSVEQILPRLRSVESITSDKRSVNVVNVTCDPSPYGITGEKTQKLLKHHSQVDNIKRIKKQLRKQTNQLKEMDSKLQSLAFGELDEYIVDEQEDDLFEEYVNRRKL